MINVLNRTLWKISFIFATCHILGALSIDTVSSSSLPPNVLQTIRNVNGSEIRKILNNTRRIIRGRKIIWDRPYMVYLKLPQSHVKFQEYRRWLCGGVIIHEEYILTSAACIEDVKHFYVVSGTFRFSFNDDRFSNPCIKNGAKKAIWKCTPRNYVFDGHENDNIRWMNNDIAIVKLEDEFDFTRRVRGCDYAPKPICYNNQTQAYEEPGTLVTLAGWGSTDSYNEWVNSRRLEVVNHDSQDLMVAHSEVLNKHQCKQRWGHRYHHIIENYMICTADMGDDLSEICKEKYVDCTDIASESDEENRRNLNLGKMAVHSAHHLSMDARKYDENAKEGGFCENDHGGPLIFGEGVTAVAIGVISACLVREKTNKCYGPFLYTSIFKNRVLINCAIYKDQGQDCNKMFRAGTTHTETEMSWSDHPDGPAKNEIKARRKQEEQKLQTQTVNGVVTANVTNKDTNTSEHQDSPRLHAGLIVRAHSEEEDKKATVITAMKNSSAVNKTAV